MRYSLVSVVPVAILLATSGCGDDSRPAESAATPSPSPSKDITIRGTMEAPLEPFSLTDDPLVGMTPCVTRDGYDDIQTGAQVTVRDAAGKTVALGVLREGVLDGDGGKSDGATPCSFPFTVEGVPGGEDFYSIEVASRGTVNFPESDLHRAVLLTVG